ncbi:DUF2510 domain-containing protein [Mycobacterium sp. 29Ha]|nr:DUF2510 domain-containing protein [Mycobacterium sp. 29Ha]MDV3135005.1 DUF2510 domain-containing protein [Mycobacterium sp. 29Ha]
MTTPLPPPGWYPDPRGTGGRSYWDGRRWTPASGQLSEGPAVSNILG